MALSFSSRLGCPVGLRTPLKRAGISVIRHQGKLWCFFASDTLVGRHPCREAYLACSFVSLSAGRSGIKLPARSTTAIRAHLFDGLEGIVGDAAHRYEKTSRGFIDSHPTSTFPVECLILFLTLLCSTVPSVLDHVAAALTTAIFLADADPSAAADAVSNATDAAAAVADTASKKGGFFGFFSDSFEQFLKLIDAGLDNAGVPFSYGFAIIVITVLVKVATYPLSKKQVESTLSMQALQPRVKELQAKFANDSERLQVETAKLYQTAGVNPLAGCLPTLATIPVFIGLYRALSNVADEGLLTEGFFWIPSLAGPTKLNGGLGWLSLQDGAPPLGWHDTIAYLVLPVLLVVSQFVSQKIISPPQSTDPSQQQTQNILKFIPLMIGYFSLNVPSGLTLYWFTNNIITTAQQVYLRKKFTPVEVGAGAMGGTVINTPAPEVPKGPTGKDLNARRSPKTQIIDVEAESVNGASSASTAGMSAGEKFRAIKAREAARKAAEQAAKGAAPAPAPAASAEQAEQAEGNGNRASVTVVDEADKVVVPPAAPAKDGFAQKSNASRGKSSAKKGKKK